MRLEGEIAWVTGAARGIGWAVARAFAQEGAKLAMNDLRSLEEAAAKIEGMGRPVLALRGDVTKAQQVQEMAEEILEKFGRIDILVNNAGGGLNVPFSIVDLQEEDWDRVVDLNLKAAFLCSKAVIPSMRKQGRGKIINLSSLAGRSSGLFG